jgi:hypothetical protein
MTSFSPAYLHRIFSSEWSESLFRKGPDFCSISS